MDDILKSNFKVKNPVVVDESGENKKESIGEMLKKKALSSLGGSMVYVERTGLHWDGEVANEQKSTSQDK